MEKNNKVVLGMSGGVDSTAAALLLKEQGYEVIGLNFDVFGKGEESAVRARTAAEKLGIKFVYKDISKEFNRNVITYFYNEYVSGRTPNPCVMCNKTIKYKVLLEEADRIGAYWIATGHYADTCQINESGAIGVKICANRKKDQSYVLWKLGQDELRRVIFPLKNNHDKENIRELLRSNGFENAEAKDSQEICFIENDDYMSFLTEQMGLKPVPGDFTDKEGNVIGQHQGICKYTIGQRKGLGVTFGKPVFVTEIDAKQNRVVLGDNQDLFKTRIISSNNNFCIPGNFEGKKLRGKIRYAAPFAECEIRMLADDRIETVFADSQRAPTPGQSIVWYDGDILLGGGLIERG